MQDEPNGISIDNIAAIFLDQGNGTQMIFTRDALINQLQRVCIEINKSFDKTFEDEFKELSSNLSDILPILFIGKRNATVHENRLLSTCGALLTNAGNTIIASTQTLRCGFRMQSGILLRTIVEMCATVVHLLSQPDILEDFLNDKIRSTKSISIADKQIPLFGMIWGVLSQKQIHINSLHADQYLMTEYTRKDEIPASVTLGMLGASILIFGIVTELTFINQIESPKYWEVVDKGAFKFIPPNSDQFKWAKDLLKNGDKM